MAGFNHQFQIALPDGWEDKTVFTYQGPLDSGVQHNIVLLVDATVGKKTELADYVKSQMATSKEALPGFQMIKEGEKTLPSGIKAHEVVYKYMPTDQQALYQKQLYLIIDGKAYAFTSTFSKKTLQTIAAEVDQIVAGFRPLQAQE
ncbi:MAG TPA: DcrB-related protein [Chitinivibrionales bacterium]|nr:DcrB-related protein [Chitinivibrionales bacterium]